MSHTKVVSTMTILSVQVSINMLRDEYRHDAGVLRHFRWRATKRNLTISVCPQLTLAVYFSEKAEIWKFGRLRDYT